MAAPRVLVADGDARRRQITTTILRFGGYEVVAAARLVDAVAAARDGIDALVTAPELGDGDAIAYAKRLRADPATARLPIVVIAYGDAKRDAVASALGPDAFLAAPYRPSDLYALLERLRPSS